MTSKVKNIIIKCPGCSTKLAIPDSACGKKVRCTKCKKVLKIPEKKVSPPVEPSQPSAPPQLSAPPQPAPSLTAAPQPIIPQATSARPSIVAPPVSQEPSKQKKKVSRLKVGKIADISEFEMSTMAVSAEEAQRNKDLAEKRRAEIDRLRQINEGEEGYYSDNTEVPIETSTLNLRNIIIAGLAVFFASTIYFVFINPPTANFYSSTGFIPDESGIEVNTDEAKRKANREEAAKLAIIKKAQALKRMRLSLCSKYSCSKVKIDEEKNLATIEYDFRNPREKSSWQSSTKTYINKAGSLVLKGTKGSGIFYLTPQFQSPFSIAIFLKAIEPKDGKVNIYLHRLRDRKMMEIGSGRTIKLGFSQNKAEKSNDGPSNNLRLYNINQSSNYSPYMGKFMTSSRMLPVAGASLSGFPWAENGAPLIIRSKAVGYPEVIVNSSKIKWIKSSHNRNNGYTESGNNTPANIGGSNDSREEGTEIPAPEFIFDGAQVVIKFSGMKELEIQKMAIKVPCR